MGRALIAATAVVGAGMAVSAASGFEAAMAELRSVANPTEQQFRRLRDSILESSGELGIGVKEIAAAYTTLLRASVPLTDVLGDAGEAALKFSRVGQIDVSSAAEVMADSMKVFNVTATESVNILSSAADASSTDVRGIALAFAQSSAVWGQAGQSMTDLAAAIGIMANAGIKGSDAGTSLKTMMLRLMAPVDEGAKTIEKLGIRVRDAQGHMLGAADIAAELQRKLGALGSQERDDALRNLFGTDAVRAGAVMLKAGKAGFDEFREAMWASLTVAEKFETIMDTLTGAFQRLKAEFGVSLVMIGDTMLPVVKAGVDALALTLRGINMGASAFAGLAGKYLHGLGIDEPDSAGDAAASGQKDAVLGPVANPEATKRELEQLSKIDQDMARRAHEARIGLLEDEYERSVTLLRSRSDAEQAELRRAGASRQALNDLEQETIDKFEAMRRERNKRIDEERVRLADQVREAELRGIADPYDREVAMIRHRADVDIAAARRAGDVFRELAAERIRAIELETAAAERARRIVLANKDREHTIAELDLRTRFEGIELERRLLELQRTRAIEQARAAGESEDLVLREFAYRERLIDLQQSAQRYQPFTSAGFFSAAEAGFGQAGRGLEEVGRQQLEAQRRIADATERTARNTAEGGTPLMRYH
ncbi:MAG: phage tail tape measure protein [Phycisphaerales bacterium]|nr:phage tail tape measure protein [Phycisphaerales bacterium]